jgi:DNA processing protein
LLPVDPAPLLQRAQADVARWAAAGIGLVTVLDDDYPTNLHAVHDRPALLFIRGAMAAADQRSIAVIGSRRATAEGIKRAGRLAQALTRAGYVVASGLAAGVDATAHRSALAAGGRTLAVIGTGVDRTYPAEHAELQRTIADAGAVISCFWPDSPPARERFPIRNGLMSGLTRGTVIVAASEHSGTRTQARRALAHGRPVFLDPTVTQHAWARDLAARPNVHVTGDVDAIDEILRAREATGPLTPG